MAIQNIIRPVPVHGLNTSDDSIVFDAPYSPYMKNVVVERTRVKKRMGYTKLGFAKEDLPLQGAGMTLVNYKDACGDSHLIALTTTNAYLYIPELRDINYKIIEGKQARWLDITPVSKQQFSENYDINVNFYKRTDTDLGVADVLSFGAAESFDIVIDDAAENRRTLAETFWIEFRNREESGFTYFTYYSTVEEKDIWVALTELDEYVIAPGITFKIKDRTIFNNVEAGIRPVVVFTIPAPASQKVRGLSIKTDDYYRSTVDYTLKIILNKNETDSITYTFAPVGQTGEPYTQTDVDWDKDRNKEIILLDADNKEIGIIIEISNDYTSFNNEHTITVSKYGLFDIVNFTGGLANRWSYTIVTDMNKFTKKSGSALMLTNNVDGIFYYEGEVGERLKRFTYIDAADGKTKEPGIAREIIEFWNCLFLCNFQLQSFRDVRSLLHSSAGNVSSWLGAGTSGSYVLTDSRGEIRRVVKLGANIVIYSSNSITIGRYYGGLTPFAFPTMVYETGLISDKAVWDSVNVHFFLGNDQRVYAYYGETHLVPVGQRIEETLFGQMDVEKLNTIVTGLDIGRHKLHFCIPTPDVDFPRAAYTLNYKREELSWEYHYFGDSIRDFGVLVATLTWYCDEPPFTFSKNDETDSRDVYCDKVAIYCDESYGQQGYDTTCFISAFTVDNKDYAYVYEMNNINDKDDDKEIDFELHSPDFTVDAEENFARWQWLSITAKADIANSKIDIQYAVENNLSDWHYVSKDLELSDNWKTYRLPLDVDARVIRFRILNYSGDVQLRGLFKTKVVTRTERD